MIEKQFFTDQCIIDCLDTTYGIKVSELTRIFLGADMDASVYKAQTYGQLSDQLSYFIKVKRGTSHDSGVIIPLLLHDAGISHIIVPIKTYDKQLTCFIDNFTLIVYPFIDGQNGFSHTLTADQWVAFGKALRQVHECDVPLLIKNIIKRESYSPQWRDLVKSIYVQIDVGLKVSDQIAEQLLAFMKEKREIIERLVERSEQLG